MSSSLLVGKLPGDREKKGKEERKGTEVSTVKDRAVKDRGRIVRVLDRGEEKEEKKKKKKKKKKRGTIIRRGGSIEKGRQRSG